MPLLWTLFIGGSQPAGLCSSPCVCVWLLVCVYAYALASDYCPLVSVLAVSVNLYAAHLLVCVCVCARACLRVR